MSEFGLSSHGSPQLDHFGLELVQAILAHGHGEFASNGAINHVKGIIPGRFGRGCGKGGAVGSFESFNDTFF
jgi:hypothetical protein